MHLPDGHLVRIPPGQYKDDDHWDETPHFINFQYPRRWQNRVKICKLKYLQNPLFHGWMKKRESKWDEMANRLEMEIENYLLGYSM